MARKTKAQLAGPATYEKLVATYPDAHCELDHATPFQLLVATVLSAQSTDKGVNLVTPDLFAKYPDARSLAKATPDVVEKLLGRLGMFRQKTKSILGLAKLLVERHHGEVPRTLAELIELPGVGRKTANVVLGVAFGAPEGVVVDTHVQRLAQRLGWSKESTPEKIEQDLMRTFDRPHWDRLSHTLIFHGRRCCFAQKPACSTCPIAPLCPSAGKAETIGRKPPRNRPAARPTSANREPPTAKRTPTSAKREPPNAKRTPTSAKRESAQKNKA